MYGKLEGGTDQKLVNESTLKFREESYIVRTIYLGLREEKKEKIRKNAMVKGRGESESNGRERKNSERMNEWSGE